MPSRTVSGSLFLAGTVLFSGSIYLPVYVFGGLGGSITDVGHNVHTLKLPSDSVVNTFWLPPVATELHVSITLMASKFLRPLFHNFRHFCWSNSHGCPFEVKQ